MDCRLKRERIMYLDRLRFAATIAVIVLHTSAQNWSNFDGRSLTWNIFNAYDSAVRWCVPVFVMISGTVFLSREIELKEIYGKYVLRIVIAYGVWSAFYAVEVEIKKIVLGWGNEVSFRQIVSNFISGRYHMWFLPMIVGIYMSIPIIKRIVDSEKIAKYFLMLSLLFAFFIPQMMWLAEDFFDPIIGAVVNKVGGVVSNIEINLVLGFPFYFILGYLLYQEKLTKAQRISFYALGIIGFVVTLLLNAIVAWKTGTPCQKYYDNFSINVFLEAIAVYIWCQYGKYKSSRFDRIIAWCAKHSFGVYLVHVAVLDGLQMLGLNTGCFWPILSVPIISCITAVLSFVVAAMLRKIPVIGEWIS